MGGMWGPLGVWQPVMTHSRRSGAREEKGRTLGADNKEKELSNVEHDRMLLIQVLRSLKKSFTVIFNSK